jgi:hypothetical protein
VCRAEWPGLRVPSFMEVHCTGFFRGGRRGVIAGKRRLGAASGSSSAFDSDPPSMQFSIFRIYTDYTIPVTTTKALTLSSRTSLSNPLSVKTMSRAYSIGAIEDGRKKNSLVNDGDDKVCARCAAGPVLVVFVSFSLSRICRVPCTTALINTLFELWN